jgi:hypothetical protein
VWGRISGMRSGAIQTAFGLLSGRLQGEGLGISKGTRGGGGLWLLVTINKLQDAATKERSVRNVQRLVPPVHAHLLLVASLRLLT